MPVAHVPWPPPSAAPAVPPASGAARLSPRCGGKTPASARSGSAGHVRAAGGKKSYQNGWKMLEEKSLGKRHQIYMISSRCKD